MDDLRERFKVLDHVTVADPLPLDRGTRLPAPSNLRRSPRRVATIAIAALATAVSLAVLVRAFGTAPAREAVDVGTSSPTVLPGETIPVGGDPNAVAVGADGVWVSAFPADGPPYHLVRLDPVTGAVVARIEVPGLPMWEVGGGGLVALPDGVWVTGTIDRPDGAGCCGDAIVYRVDPTTNEVVEQVDLGPGSGADLWIDDTGVWVLVFDEAPQPGISVARLDPVSLEEVERIALPTDWAKQVFGFDGSIWVHGNREGADLAVVPDVLFRIDPATNRYTGTVDLPSAEFSFAVDETSIWQRDADGVIRVDPRGPLTRVPLGGMAEHCCDHIVGDRMGGVWAIARRGAPERLELVHVTDAGEIDARSEVEVPEGVLESVAVAFDPEHRTLWLAQLARTVTPLRIEED
jgi:hypothetical protein